MTDASRRALAAVVVVLVSGSAFPACSDSAREPGAVGTSANGGSAIGIESSMFFVTLENRAGSPLLSVQVTIHQVGGVVKFDTSLARLEAGEKRNISLDQFRSADGTRFNLRQVRPRNVTVGAVDMQGKRYEAAAPWQ